jgi:hypothetical protein
LVIDTLLICDAQKPISAIDLTIFQGHLSTKPSNPDFSSFSKTDLAPTEYLQHRRDEIPFLTEKTAYGSKILQENVNQYRLYTLPSNFFGLILCLTTMELARLHLNDCKGY